VSREAAHVSAQAGSGALAAAAALLSGAAAALTVPPFGAGWLIWAAFVPLLLACADRSPRQAFALAFPAGVTLFVALAYGLYPLYPQAFAIVVVGLATVFASIFAAHAWLRPRSAPWLRAPLLPALWVPVEAASAMANAPWSASLTQVDHPALLQAASLLGCHWISFQILLVNAAVFELAVALRARGRAALGEARAWLPLLAALALVGAGAAYGHRALASRDDLAPDLAIASVQPVVAPHAYANLGLEPRFRRELRQRLARLSDEAARPRPDLLLWPEGGNGLYNFRVPELAREVAGLARRSGAALLLSSYDLDSDGRLFNALYSVSPAGEVLGRYAKTRLTPFGERHFTSGRELAPLATPHGEVGVLICFESTFGDLARRLTALGASLLVVSSSDASFLHSSFPLLHAAAATYRAVENRRWVIVASNAGPSLIVSPFGLITARTGFLDEGVLTGRVAARRDRTLYTRLGDAPLLLACAALIALALGQARAAARARGGGARESAGPSSVGLRPAKLALALVGALLAGLALAAASLALASREVTALRGSFSRSLEAFLHPPQADIRPDTADEYRQTSPLSCGPAALAYLLSYLGSETREADLLPLVRTTARGTSLADLAEAARRRGFVAWGERQNWAALVEAPKPLLAHLGGNHYVVVLSTGASDRVDLFDPARGYLRLAREAFLRAWRGDVLVVRFGERIPPGAAAALPADPSGAR